MNTLNRNNLFLPNYFFSFLANPDSFSHFDGILCCCRLVNKRLFWRLFRRLLVLAFLHGIPAVQMQIRIGKQSRKLVSCSSVFTIKSSLIFLTLEDIQLVRNINGPLIRCFFNINRCPFVLYSWFFFTNSTLL